MSDRDREAKALRVITVSGRSALQKSTDRNNRQELQDRVHALLADLEQEVIRDGADPEILGAIERERRRVYEPAGPSGEEPAAVSGPADRAATDGKSNRGNSSLD